MEASEITKENNPITAVKIAGYGPPRDVLGLGTVPTPQPGPKEVRIRVCAAAINKGDWHVVVGRPYLVRAMFGLFRPSVPVIGQEVAGAVVAVGGEVTTLAVGDEVFGELSHGAFAPIVCAPADRLVKKPSGVSFEEAAALPTSGSTALRFLREHGRVAAGQTVLINGASGGVGSYAVQLAKYFGAEVTGVCSSKNVELVRGLGADHVVDYTQTSLSEVARRYDVVMDIVGNHPLSVWRRLLSPKGTYLFVGGKNGDWLGPFPWMLRLAIASRKDGQRFISGVVMPTADELGFLAERTASGDIRPAIGRRISLAEVPAALDDQGKGHVAGKTVIVL